MRRHMVVYPWRVALFVLCCLAWMAALASIPLLAIFVIHSPNGRGCFLSLSCTFGGAMLSTGFMGLVELSGWAFDVRYLSQEHRDYVMAWKWANDEYPGPVKDPWGAM